MHQAVISQNGQHKTTSSGQRAWGGCKGSIDGRRLVKAVATLSSCLLFPQQTPPGEQGLQLMFFLGSWAVVGAQGKPQCHDAMSSPGRGCTCCRAPEYLCESVMVVWALSSLVVGGCPLRPPACHLLDSLCVDQDHAIGSGGHQESPTVVWLCRTLPACNTDTPA